MGGTRDLNPNLAAAARERAPGGMAEGNKRLSQAAVLVENTKRELWTIRRLHKNRREAREGSNSAASSVSAPFAR